MTKTALNSTIQEILTRNGIELSSQLAIDLLGLSIKAPRVVVPQNPPLVGEIPFDSLVHSIDDITDIYCQWFKEYKKVKNEKGELNFSKSSKSKTGYHYECKEAESHWKLYAKDIAQIKEDILMEKNAVLDGIKTIEEAKEEIASLELKLNKLTDLRLNKVNYSKDLIESTEVPMSTKESIEQPIEIVKSFPSKTKESK